MKEPAQALIQEDETLSGSGADLLYISAQTGLYVRAASLKSAVKKEIQYSTDIDIFNISNPQSHTTAQVYTVTVVQELKPSEAHPSVVREMCTQHVYAGGRHPLSFIVCMSSGIITM